MVKVEANVQKLLILENLYRCGIFLGIERKLMVFLHCMVTFEANVKKQLILEKNITFQIFEINRFGLSYSDNFEFG